MTTRRRLRPATTLAVAVLVLAGCGTADGRAGTPTTDEDAAVHALASFYPLEFLTARIGAGRVSVASLTPPNVDPHNLELSPRTVADLEAADLVVHLGGFQPAVDDAVALTGATAVDAAEHTELRAGGHGHTHDGEHGDDDEHTDGDSHDHGHDHGPLDPHFWLDPALMAEVAEGLADALTEIDPDGAQTYADNAAALTEELAELADEYRTGLQQCAQDTIVVAHEAYGYLLADHGVDQEGLSGLDPEAEPSPARLAEIGAVIERTGATTIFTEALLGSTVSEALAADLGVTTAVLDPLENQLDPAADYLDVMRANLEALRTALDCE